MILREETPKKREEPVFETVEGEQILCTSCFQPKLKDLKMLYDIKIQNEQHLFREMRTILGHHHKKLELIANHRYYYNLNKKKQKEFSEVKQERYLLEKENTDMREYKDKLKLLIEERKKTLVELKERQEQYQEIAEIKRLEANKSRINKIKEYEDILSIHNVFPNLEAPLFFSLKPDDFEEFHDEEDEAGEGQLKREIQLEIIGLPREVSQEHSSMIMEQFTRIASMIQFLILIYDLPLPISIVKHNNILWFQFLNDFSKYTPLKLEPNSQKDFQKAVTLLFIAYVTIANHLGVELDITLQKTPKPQLDIFNIQKLIKAIYADPNSQKRVRNSKFQEYLDKGYFFEVINATNFKLNEKILEFEIIE